MKRIDANQLRVGMFVMKLGGSWLKHPFWRTQFQLSHQGQIDDILKVVGRHYNVARTDLLSPRRARTVVMPRQVGMYLAKKMTSRSLPEIGRRFGGRDHSTVLHAVRKIEEQIKTDDRLAREVALLIRLVEQA